MKTINVNKYKEWDRKIIEQNGYNLMIYIAVKNSGIFMMDYALYKGTRLLEEKRNVYLSDLEKENEVLKLHGFEFIAN